MKKRIPYIVALAWMAAVALLAFADGLAWSRERMRSAYLDGCAEGDRIYLVENMERDGILYVMDSDGRVREVSLASQVERGSFFAKILYEDSLYGLLVRKGALEEEPLLYRIVRFDDSGQAAERTREFTLEHPGILTGFSAESKGFYLTVVLEDRISAEAYFVGKEELEAGENQEEGEEERAPLVKKPVRMGCGPSGRTLVEARYEKGAFLCYLDDGRGWKPFRRGRSCRGRSGIGACLWGRL